MGIDFYYHPLSAPCRSVMLLAKELGVELNLKMTDIMKQEQLTPEFLNKNPMHTVPTCDENGFYMSESRAILMYLVTKYARKDTLYPKVPRERYAVDQKLFFDLDFVYGRFGEAYYTILFGNQPYSEEKMKKLDEALQWTDDILGKSDWIAGEGKTIADYTMAVTLTTIDSVGHDLSKFKNILAYIRRCGKDMKDFDEINTKACQSFREFVTPVLEKAIPK